MDDILPHVRRSGVTVSLHISYACPEYANVSISHRACTAVSRITKPHDASMECVGRESIERAQEMGLNTDPVYSL